MCGIAGIWQRDGRPIERLTIDRFIRALAHRGPDGQGVLVDDGGSLALAHRRLAILDLSTAAEQPMRSQSGRYEITYNGEVYNFLELRSDLEAAGCRFRTETDTEVVLAAYERWGPDCQLRFNGMWSFAIWDRHDRRLVVARDRFGVKPLYVLVEPRRFAFASELKAFVHLEGFEPVANQLALQARLADNFGEHLLLCGIEVVPPGHWLEVTPETVDRHRWWNTLDHLIKVPRELSAQAEEFRHLLTDACRLRLRSDVRLGTSLSGGLDSSSVLSAIATAHRTRHDARRTAPEWQRAFIASFPGCPQDETEYALLVARTTGAVPLVQSLTGRDFRPDIDAYLSQFEEIGGLFGAAAWMMYREMRRDGTFVSLDGHGSDELLGGYDVHILLALMRGRGIVFEPYRALDLINTLHGMVDRAPASKAMLAAMTVPAFRHAARRLPLAQLLSEMLLRDARVWPDSAEPAARDEQREIDKLGPLTGSLYRSFHRHLLPRILRNFDVHSMGHGVEVRMPFMDWRVVRYAFSVPETSKVGGGYSKRLLREAMRGSLPDSIRLRRQKVGYNVPVAQWLSDGLQDWLWDELNDREFLHSELWDGPALLASARAKREAGTAWHPAEAHKVALAATAHWWQTRWVRLSRASAGRVARGSAADVGQLSSARPCSDRPGTPR